MKERIREYVRTKAREYARNIKVCLLGYGTTNKAVYRTISDLECIGEIVARQSAADALTPDDGLRFITGKDAMMGLDEDIIFASPSVRRERLTVRNDASVISDTDIFFSQKRDNIFLVSGSDGKSTVTSIASLLLSPTFPTLFTGGNLGTPVATASLTADAFLLELSSFNLRYSLPRGKRGLLTNVTPNHLDWHDSLEEYEGCKMRLIKSVDEPILPIDCRFNEELARRTSSFALVSADTTDSTLRKRYDTLHTVTLQTGEIAVDGRPVLSLSNLRRRERHNVINFMSAVALTLGYTTEERIREIAESFSGLEHRCESFTLSGKEYVNSSIDTTPERTRATLMSLGRPVHLILGGRGKGLSNEPMRTALLSYARSISVYGEAADGIVTWLDSDPELSRIPHGKFKTLKEAIDCADLGARGTVLLSPSATAYGEFKSFVERGRFFKSYLTEKHGDR